jgi:hypothetical protein
MTLPRFHVPQMMGNFLMYEERYGQEGIGWASLWALSISVTDASRHHRRQDGQRRKQAELQ